MIRVTVHRQFHEKMPSLNPITRSHHVAELMDDTTDALQRWLPYVFP